MAAGAEVAQHPDQDPDELGIDDGQVRSALVGAEGGEPLEDRGPGGGAGADAGDGGARARGGGRAGGGGVERDVGGEGVDEELPVLRRDGRRRRRRRGEGLARELGLAVGHLFLQGEREREPEEEDEAARRRRLFVQIQVANHCIESEKCQ